MRFPLGAKVQVLQVSNIFAFLFQICKGIIIILNKEFKPKSGNDILAEWSKACDSKSLLRRRRRFKSCRCRLFDPFCGFFPFLWAFVCEPMVAWRPRRVMTVVIWAQGGEWFARVEIRKRMGELMVVYGAEGVWWHGHKLLLRVNASHIRLSLVGEGK